jgi:hypothetical protein
MSADDVILIGVRHHSPACARYVRRVIETVKPAFVLIEGPSDFNPNLSDLRLAHVLPIAIFSFCASATESRASYAPFCRYSPEWQALLAAWSIGAIPLFCDLPAWHPDFGDRANRYADPHPLLIRSRAARAALARELDAEGDGALWDALAEQADDEALPRILDQFFGLLRPDDAADPKEAQREASMASYLAWARREAAGRPVLLVCGGWHVGGVRAALHAADGAEPRPHAPPDDARVGSYIVPYSYVRLDRFTGYAAGMPSPGYYDALHDRDLNGAADWAMRRIAEALRAIGQVVSTADLIAWSGHAQALARIRGHRGLLRTDILDAALATLIKDALEGPAAWAQSGAIASNNDPVVIAMLRALSGRQEGQVSRQARRPPLVTDVERRLGDEGISFSRRAQTLSIDWRNEALRPRAHLLHQLSLLALPGITREGPAHADARDLAETFEIVAHPDWFGALAEASIWGGTLPMAAAGRLSARIAEHAGDLNVLADALSDALFAGLVGLGQSLAERIAGGLAISSDVAALGHTGRQIVRLFRFGEVFGAAAHAGLGAIAESMFARTLWLLPLVRSAGEGANAIDAVLACRDLMRAGDELRLDRRAAIDVFARCVAEPETPPGLAGSALGCLIACDAEDAASGIVTTRIRRFGLPESLGDFLTGLFALAREELRDTQDVLDAVAGLVAAWADGEFLRALPSMRLAFAWFPPSEREQLAQQILQRHGLGAARAQAEALAWMRQSTPVRDQVAALALEARTAERLAAHGLT